MVEIKGNIFDKIGIVDAICITTNLTLRNNGDAICGAGIAKAAQIRWPEFEKNLGVLIRSGNKSVCKVYEENKTSILAFPTKRNWKINSNFDLIKRSLRDLAKMIKENNWSVVCLPRPGCNNGGLNWSTYKPLVEQELKELGISDNIIIFSL
jgi:hypothetical protein